MSARIVAYRLAFGIEPDREVLNTCDVRVCLNPRHLVLAGEKSQATMRKRFEENVAKAGPDECWLWKQKPGAAGYGGFRWAEGTTPPSLTTSRGNLRTVLSLKASMSARNAATACAATQPTSSLP